jgi:hypothetical protein
MKTFDLQPMRAVAVVSFLLRMFFAGLPASAQQTVTAKPPAGTGLSEDPAPYPQITWQAATRALANPARRAGEDQEAEATPQKSGIEGVRIHGHWVIDVKNPDGKVTEHREFDNSLVTNNSALQDSTGDQLLAGLLSGALSIGDPAIAFISTPTGMMPAQPGPPAFCVAPISNLTCDVFYTVAGSFFSTTAQNFDVQSGSPYATTETPGLLTLVSFNSGAVNWVLSGNFIAPAARTIGAVETRAAACVPLFGSQTYTKTNSVGVYYMSGTGAGHHANVSPGACALPALVGTENQGVPLALTYTVIGNGSTPAPITVVAGQGIFVTVTITFS